MGMPPPPPPEGSVQYSARPPRTSGLAIASMVLGIVWIYWIGSILAIIFGHIALSQIRKDPNLGGRGMAIAGVVLGYVGVAIVVVGIVAFAAFRTTSSSVGFLFVIGACPAL